MHFDSSKFAPVVEAAKARAANSPAWLRAIDRAAAGILSGELIVTVLAHGALVTSANGSYHANGECQCAAYRHGHKACPHRAAARLVELYEETLETETTPAPAPTKAEPKAPTITRSIERDPRNGARYAATYCDGWAI
jgi:hypothetical protein